MKAQISSVDDHGKKYTCLAFVCPGCQEGGGSGLHMLPVNTTETSPAWDWDGNLELPTISPSILTGRGSSHVCHSFLKAGVFHFLGDCTHSMAGKYLPMPDLPQWFLDESAAL